MVNLITVYISDDNKILWSFIKNYYWEINIGVPTNEMT